MVGLSVRPIRTKEGRALSPVVRSSGPSRRHRQADRCCYVAVLEWRVLYDVPLRAMSGSKGRGATASPAPKTSIWAKLTSYQSKPTEETFPELPDVLIWVRILLGVLYGISLGLRNQVGWVGILFALNVTTMLPTVYVSAFLGADPEKFKQGLTFVGVPNAMATCLLVWIVVFTHQHEEEESAFARAVVQKVADAVTSAGEETTDGSEADGAASSATAGNAGEGSASAEDTEF